MQTLLVFSHLRWNFVFQRPQHLLTRLAAHYNVVVVEEPVQDTCAAVLKAQTVAPGITVLRPHTSITALGFHDDQISMLHPLLAEYLETHRIDDYVVWLYTPMALPLVAPLHPRALVYDCMDELAAFLGAPRQLRQREAALLKSADAIFTGGPSLYEAKRELGAHVLCLPSSVDAKHFAPAGADGSAEPARCTDLLQSGIGGPRLGFFGVVDERMDLALIARLADASPHWQVVMVGPVVKIDSAHLPQRANLHWLGQQPYELLPGLVESWQVCLLPFALNDATRFISPTKTLEYMAAGKPVVSTAIHDVAVLYGEVVRIATDHDEFIAACRDALAETDEAAADRRRAMAEQVAGGSWDETAERVHVAIEQAIARVDSRPDSVASRRRAIERARDSHQQPPAANGI